MNYLKIVAFLEFLVKVFIAISVLFIMSGVIAHTFDLYNILRNGYYIGIPLFLISLIGYLFLRLLRNFKTKTPVTKLLIGLILLCVITISLYIVFSKIMEAVSR